MCGLLVNCAWELSLGKKSSLKFWNYPNKIVWPGEHRNTNSVQMGLECHVAKDLQKLRDSPYDMSDYTKPLLPCAQGGGSLPQGQLCQGSWVASNNNRLWKVVKCYTRTHRIKATTEASGPEMSKTRGNKDPKHFICDQQWSSREDQSFYLIFLSPCPEIPIQKGESWTSLVVQWLRIDLPMQETQVQSLVSFHTPQGNWAHVP